MAATVRVVFRSEVVQDDLGYVPQDKLKEAVRRLKRDPDCGKRLGGQLRGCQSIRIEGSENRLVYRQRQNPGNGSGDTEVEIIAIGRRRDDAVYDTAAHRAQS